MIQAISRRVVAVVEGWKAGSGQVFLHCVVDGIEVHIGLASRVILLEEVIRLGGLKRFGSCDIVHSEAEPLGQGKNHLVSAIDKFSAVFAHLAIHPGTGVRMHAPANTP